MRYTSGIHVHRRRHTNMICIYIYVGLSETWLYPKKTSWTEKNLTNHWKTWGIPDVCTNPCGDYGQTWRSKHG